MLVLAGVYNLTFGAWAVFVPNAFFDWFALETPLYPSIWACLGMVVGMYGLLYLHAARRLDHAAPIVAVGLLGKILGPLGLIMISDGDLPLRVLPLIALNDLVWWLPFGAFLLEGTRYRLLLSTATPYLCAGLHVLAGLAMLFLLRPGTEAEPDLAVRMAYIGMYQTSWQAGLVVWMVAGMSAVAFFSWWAPATGRRGAALVVVFIAGLGLAFDLVGEGIYVGWLPAVVGDAAQFAAAQRLGTVLTAVFANACYTTAGIMLTLTTPSLPRHVRATAWTVWIAGIALSMCGLMGWATGLVASASILFPAFVLLCLMLANRLS